MPITVNGAKGIDLIRITTKLDRVGSDRDGMRDILETVGDLIEREARVMARQKDIIQTQRMIDSIKSRVNDRSQGLTLTVSPFENYYAIYQEFGAQRNAASRKAMFANLRDLGVIGLRPAKPGFSDTVHKQREFLGPAFHRHAMKTVDMIREWFRED